MSAPQFEISAHGETAQSVTPGTVPGIPHDIPANPGMAPLTPHKSDTELPTSVGQPRLVIKSAASTQSGPFTPGQSSGLIKSAPAALSLARSAKRDTWAPVGKRVQTLYPAGKPPKTKFVRIHPSKDYRQMGVWTYEEPDTKELYYVSPDLEIPASYGMAAKSTDLYAAVTHDGTYFIWWVARSESTWYRSAMRAIPACTGAWYKVVSRKGPNIYDLYPPEESIPEPEWASLPSFMEMLLSAFDGKMIESLEHPVIKKIRGLVDDAN